MAYLEPLGIEVPMMLHGIGEPTVLEDVEIDDDLTRSIMMGISAPLHVEMMVGYGSVGVATWLGTDGERAGSVSRGIVPVADPDSDLGLVEGIEVSTFPVGQLVTECMRYLADGPEWSGAPEPLVMSPELSRLIVRAIQDGDNDKLERLLEYSNLEDVPEMLVALSRVTGDAMITVGDSTAGSLMRLLQTRRGWIEMTMDTEGDLHHRARTLESIEEVLLNEITKSLAGLLSREGQ